MRLTINVFKAAPAILCLAIAACGGNSSSQLSPKSNATVASVLEAAVPGTASPDGTTIPSATQITDSSGNAWTVSGGVIYENGALAGYSNRVTLLLYDNNIIYQKNSAGGWWSWNGSKWVSSSDPRNVPVSGACGSTNGMAVKTAPVANLCGAGTASTVSGTGPWTWSCGGSNGGTTESCSASVAVPVSAATALNISGSPPTSDVAGQAYSFMPTTTNPGGGTLGFSITNMPAWASFSTLTGALTGTPSSVQVGDYSNILISVSNGSASATLAAFSITVTTGSANLSWTAPTQNTNGTPLTDLAGYMIYYGTSPSELTQTIQLADPSATSYVVSNLSAGTYYFAVAAYTTVATQSAQSSLGSKTIL
jgi:hypothetical protein